MSTYIYAPHIVSGTRELIDALDAKRLIKFDGMHFRHRGQQIAFNEAEDVIICWGAFVPPIGKVRILNANMEHGSVLEMNRSLRRNGVVTDVSAYTYMLDVAASPLMYSFDKLHPVALRDPNYGRMVPIKQFPGYGSSHTGISYEFKAHVFNKKVIKFGIKEPADRKVGVLSDWYRTPEMGWRVNYDIPSSSHGKLRKFCVTLIDKLNLNFGVLSFGSNQSNGQLGPDDYIILRKIITSPELDASEVTLYANQIKEWAKR